MDLEDFKIRDLMILCELEEKATMLLDCRINPDFYKNFHIKKLQWLIDNKNKIIDDFNNNKDKMKFDIIMNSKYHADLKSNYILSLRQKTVEDFCNYISIFKYEMLKKKSKNEVDKKFNKFINLDDYEALQYFNKIKR